MDLFGKSFPSEAEGQLFYISFTMAAALKGGRRIYKNYSRQSERRIYALNNSICALAIAYKITNNMHLYE